MNDTSSGGMGKQVCAARNIFVPRRRNMALIADMA
jgi:hypothetical protein